MISSHSAGPGAGNCLGKCPSRDLCCPRPSFSIESCPPPPCMLAPGAVALARCSCLLFRAVAAILTLSLRGICFSLLPQLWSLNIPKIALPGSEQGASAVCDSWNWLQPCPCPSPPQRSWKNSACQGLPDLLFWASRTCSGLQLPACSLLGVQEPSSLPSNRSEAKTQSHSSFV